MPGFYALAKVHQVAEVKLKNQIGNRQVDVGFGSSIIRYFKWVLSVAKQW